MTYLMFLVSREVWILTALQKLLQSLKHRVQKALGGGNRVREEEISRLIAHKLQSSWPGSISRGKKHNMTDCDNVKEMQERLLKRITIIIHHSRSPTLLPQKRQDKAGENASVNIKQGERSANYRSNGFK